MRFFFHVIAGGERALDPEGEEIVGLGAARCKALLSAREIALDRMRTGQPVFFIAIEIADETGRILDIVTLREALANIGEPADERSSMNGAEPDQDAVERRLH